MYLHQIIQEPFGEITFYNYVESDDDFPEQLVLRCKLKNMWSPVMNEDIRTRLKPYFTEELIYKILIVNSSKTLGHYSVQMVQKYTNIDIRDNIFHSGLRTRKCADIKTGKHSYNCSETCYVSNYEVRPKKLYSDKTHIIKNYFKMQVCSFEFREYYLLVGSIIG